MVRLINKGGQAMLGSDSLMYVDGRWSISTIKEKVRERNASYQKNLPHKIAAGFCFYDRNWTSNIYWL